MGAASRRAVLAGAAALLASGCGGSSPSHLDDGQVSGELRLLTPIFEGADGKKALEGLLGQFRQANPGVSVQVDYASYSKLNEKLTTSIVGGQPYDVMLMGVGWIPPFAAKGVLADLGEDPAGLARTYHQHVAGACVWRDRVYALPIMLDTRFGIYRKDLFAEAGLSGPPRDLAQLRENAARLARREPGGKLARAGLDLLSNDLRQTFLPLMWANGGQLFTADGKVAFNSPESVAALQLMADILLVDRSEDVGFTRPGAATGVPLVQGRAAMMIGHNNVWLELKRTAPRLASEDNIGFFTLAGKREAIFAGGTLGAVATLSRRPTAAKALVRFLAAPPAALTANQQRGNVPAVVSLAESDYVKGNPAVLFAMRHMDCAYVEGGVPAWLSIRGEFKAAIESALLGRKTPKAALDDLAAKAEQAMARR